MSSIFSGAVLEPLTLFTIHAPPDRSYGPENPVPQTFRLRSAGIVQSERSDGAKPDDRRQARYIGSTSAATSTLRNSARACNRPKSSCSSRLASADGLRRSIFSRKRTRKRPRIRSTGGASGPSSRRPNTSRADSANAPAARHSSSLSRCRITTAIRRQ